jgi:hypothetical protein
MSQFAVAAKRRFRLAAIERLRGTPQTRRENATAAALLAELSAIASELSGSAAWPHVQLTRAVVDLQAAVAADRADPGRSEAVALGRAAWHRGAGPVWDAFRVVGERLVRYDADLAGRVATLLLEARPKSDPARGLRKEARAAVRDRDRDADRWRERAGSRSPDGAVPTVLAALAPPTAVDEDGWFGVEDALDRGVDLAPALATQLRRSYLGDARATRAYLPTLRAGVARGLVADRPLGGLRPVLDATFDEFSSAERPGLVDVETVDISGLREYLTGRTVCLVANSAELLEHEHGAEIDSHDVVVRFNSFALDPVRTGERTDVHATIHLHDFNWDVPVDVRLVFAGDQSAWGHNLRRHVRPGAQRLLGDDSLRWPRRTLLAPELRERCTVPTSGFNMLLVLDYLDVSPRIDLYGFNFHSGAPHRRPDAMHLPVATAHSYDVEREWVAARTVSIAPGRISLR